MRFALIRQKNKTFCVLQAQGDHKKKQDRSRRNQHNQSFIFIPSLYNFFFTKFVRKAAVAQSMAHQFPNREGVGSIPPFTKFCSRLFLYNR